MRFRQWARALPAAPAPASDSRRARSLPSGRRGGARPRFHPGSRALLSGRGGGGPRWGRPDHSRGGSGKPFPRARGGYCGREGERGDVAIFPASDSRRQRAGRREDLWATAPHPGTRGMSWPPHAGGCPRGWWHSDAADRGVRAGEGCRVAAGLPQPPLLPAQLLGDRAGEGVILHIPHLAPPPASIKLAAGGSPALWPAPVGQCCLLPWRDWLRT